ncbi:alpha/beta fold hydrolase [Herbiconiux sp. VKM Ac-2851]|uniref:alpha/beta fold hydrolase n=1 Tax=Herbiconiux sp. VKM Ac-2851 TaxID=2739025 RepID=UPI001565E280|nr:alpha/beta hydrolase [Herbiconiux sp. VKM Ac-2851]NQX34081.1 alpha/beta hydrolase [Herbiconiux sp. VKM Ac-2851]
MSNTPTVVLVHGAFADASSYAPVVRRLLDEGVTVVAPPSANRSLASDAGYIASVVSQIDGPVLLVGHSYGGAVVTVAGNEPNVVGLVYLAAYVLAEGESLGELQNRFAPSPLGEALVYTPYPIEGSSEPGIDVSVDIARFPSIFAAEVDPALTTVLAVSQRPLAAAAFGEPAVGAPAWAEKPAWGIVASADQAINPDVQRFGYERAGASVIEVDSSHLVMHAHPDAVVAVIREALASVSAAQNEPVGSSAL